MDNLFVKRATDFVRDDEAFVAMISPEPIRYFLGKAGQQGLLYDRLVIIRGTPGSGKTTLARVFDYPAINALLRNTSITGYKETIAALVECGAVHDAKPIIVGCHLNFEMDYREFWNFPYNEDLKTGLMTTLIQARSVLGWLANLRQAGHDLRNIEIIPKKNSAAGTDALGGVTGEALFEKAKVVEGAIYKITGALIAPPENELQPESVSVYRPFDVIESFLIKSENAPNLNLRPLVILDDAQFLHPQQYQALFRWLLTRDLRVCRWLLTRFDVMQPGRVFAGVRENISVDLPGVTSSRDFIEIFLQTKPDDRRGQRLAFRKIAKDMANRYLRQMPLFAGRTLTSLSDLLLDRVESFPASKQKELQQRVDSAKRKLGVTDARFSSLIAEVDSYQPPGKDIQPDIRLAMVSVLLHRYAKRTPDRMLFEELADPEPNRPLKADSTVFEAACLHLLHQFEKPFYYGIDDVCDASSENAEQFLKLCAALVQTLSTLIIRGKSPSLDARTQHKLLRDTARDVIKNWSFPDCDRVRLLVDEIARKCLNVSLQPNAKLGAGANAYGILQTEFDALPEKHSELARVLHFAVAYNAISLVPDYPCQDERWCLLELGGMVILNYQLTLKRGGFIEGTPSELSGLLKSP